jgi:RND family efflux transporter MFP subunit
LVVVAAAAFGVWQLFRMEKDSPPEEESADVLPEVSVQLAAVVQTNLQASVLAYGSVEPEPGRNGAQPARVRITSPAGGLVVEARCAEGELVSRGDELFRMDGRLAELAVAKARQAEAFAEKGVARQKRLEQIDGTSEKLTLEALQQLEAARQELAAAQTQSALLSVVAPIAGTVMQVAVRSGETVEAGRELAELVDLKRLVLVAALPSREAERVKVGMSAVIDTGSDSASGPCHSKVTFIEARVDPQTDTVRLCVAVPEAAGLRLGQFARVRIVYAEQRGGLAAPEESLEQDAGGQSVLKVAEGNMAVFRPVRTGVREGGWVEVQGEGITNGTPIVTTGGYGLGDKTRIRVVTP